VQAVLDGVATPVAATVEVVVDAPVDLPAVDPVEATADASIEVAVAVSAAAPIDVPVDAPVEAPVVDLAEVGLATPTPAAAVERPVEDLVADLASSDDPAPSGSADGGVTADTPVDDLETAFWAEVDGPRRRRVPWRVGRGVVLQIGALLLVVVAVLVRIG